MNHSEDDEPSFASGILLAIVGTFLFTLKSIFIKLAFAAGAEPTMLLMLRLVFAMRLSRYAAMPMMFLNDRWFSTWSWSLS